MTDAVPAAFQTLRTHFVDGRTRSCVEPLSIADLTAGELVVRIRYAGVNYKDCLSLYGKAKIITAFPRVAGIEFVGDVVESSSPAFTVGATVLVHGFQTGIAFDGGFAAYARVPAAHAMALPDGLDARETATLGVPGFTAAMALERFEAMDLTPASGPIAVSGATGAVGSMALGILAKAGYRTVAVTRRLDRSEALQTAGATEVLDAQVLAAPQRALEKPRFAAALDNVGGPMLSWLLRSMQDGGAVASIGNAAGNGFDGSVLPFIMRRVTLFGIVANAPWPQRQRLWRRLGSDWKPAPATFVDDVHEIALSDLMAHAERQLGGETSGRTLVTYS